MSNRQFDAVIFDLDGVITQTALTHSIAWKEMFNEYLRYRETKYGEEYREFTHTNDYLPFVDGKPISTHSLNRCSSSSACSSVS